MYIIKIIRFFPQKITLIFYKTPLQIASKTIILP